MEQTTSNSVPYIDPMTILPEPEIVGLKMPKAILVILNNETEEIVAENGRWNRLPMDGEVLRAEYKPNYQKYNE